MRFVRARFTDASTLTSSNKYTILRQAADSTSGLRSNADKGRFASSTHVLIQHHARGFMQTAGEVAQPFELLRVLFGDVVQRRG